MCKYGNGFVKMICNGSNECNVLNKDELLCIVSNTDMNGSSAQIHECNGGYLMSLGFNVANLDAEG